MLILHDDAYYDSRKPEPDLGACKNCLRFIWNNERKSFLDRTAKEWATVGLFYIFFFGALFSMFALQMWITVIQVSQLEKPYFQYINKPSSSNVRIARSTFFRQPTYDSPGIEFKPNIFSSSPFIWIKDSQTESKFNKYIKSLNDTLQDYAKNELDYDPECVEGQQRNYESYESCFFDIKRLRVCGISPYGYTTPTQPCVLIKFNKRFNWVPDCFNQTSVLPEKMPEWQRRIVKMTNKSYVWLSCDGVNNVDKELIGHIEYFPISGFPAQYFPFNGRENYLSPLVALHFTNVTVNRLISVECNLWAENIKHKRPYSLDFQLMINTS